MLAALDAVRHHRRLRMNGRALAVSSLVLLVVTVAWIFFDPRFASGVAQLRSLLTMLWSESSAITPNGSLYRGRTVALGLVALAAISTLLASFLGLFFGASDDRRVRSWLWFTMLFALWLALCVAWREVAWQGQRLRARMSLSELDAVAIALHNDWPAGDGSRHGLGSFMAYPQGQPRMLVILSPDSIPPLSSVERSEDGALRFELRADPGSGWLEWHPDGSTPAGFVGGLDQQYGLDRSVSLGRGWYLVRYQQ